MRPLVLKPLYWNEADVQRIIEAFAEEGYECSRLMAIHLWKTHSERLSAGWLFLPKTNDGIIARLSGYVELD